MPTVRDLEGSGWLLHKEAFPFEPRNLKGTKEFESHLSRSQGFGSRIRSDQGRQKHTRESDPAGSRKGVPGQHSKCEWSPVDWTPDVRRTVHNIRMAVSHSEGS